MTTSLDLNSRSVVTRALSTSGRRIPHRLLLASLLCVSLPACLQGGGEDMAASAADPLRYTGVNNLPPAVIDSDPVMRSVTDAFGITSSGSSGSTPNADPLRLCQSDPGTAASCTLKSEWNSWRLADSANRNHMLKGIAKCAMSSGFEIVAPDGSARWGGIWGMFPEWKTGRLQGQAKRERLSACILSLLNGNNLELNLCLIGPGSGYSDPCADTAINIREGGFFGDLFGQRLFALQQIGQLRQHNVQVQLVGIREDPLDSDLVLVGVGGVADDGQALAACPVGEGEGAARHDVGRVGPLVLRPLNGELRHGGHEGEGRERRQVGRWGRCLELNRCRVHGAHADILGVRRSLGIVLPRAVDDVQQRGVVHRRLRVQGALDGVDDVRCLDRAGLAVGVLNRLDLPRRGVITHPWHVIAQSKADGLTVNRPRLRQPRLDLAGRRIKAGQPREQRPRRVLPRPREDAGVEGRHPARL